MDASDTASAGMFRSPIHRPFSLGRGPGRALLLHGFPGTPGEMRPLARVLAAHGWRCDAPLLPGLGPEIDRLERIRRHDWLAAARSAWDAARDGPGPHLIAGFSMGAALALRIAQLDAASGPAREEQDDTETYPPRLLLLAPFTGFDDPRMAALPVVRLFVPRYRPFADADFDDPRVRVRLLRIDPSLDLDDPAERARIRREAAVPTRAIDEVRRLGDRAWRDAEAVTWPAYVVQGRLDATAPVERTRKLVERLGGPVRYREIDAGHDMLLSDRPGHGAMLAAVAALVGAPRSASIPA